MKNITIKIDKLPSNVKFATQKSTNKQDILLEILIANLIHNATTVDKLLEPTNKIPNKKSRELMKSKILNTILDFVNLNPQYSHILNQKGNSELLGYFDVDFMI